MIVAGAVNCVLWLVYGLLLHDAFVIFPNAANLLLGVVQLGLFCVFPRGGTYDTVEATTPESKLKKIAKEDAHTVEELEKSVSTTVVDTEDDMSTTNNVPSFSSRPCLRDSGDSGRPVCASDDDAKLWPPLGQFHQNLNAFVPLSKAAANPIIVEDLKNKLQRLGQAPEDDMISYTSDTDVNTLAGGMYACSFDMIRKAHPEARIRLHHYLDPERPLGYFDDYYLIKFGRGRGFRDRTRGHQGPPPDGYTDVTGPGNTNMAWLYHDDEHDHQVDAEQLIKIAMVERGFRVNFVTFAMPDGRLHGEILAVPPQDLYSVLQGYRAVAFEVRRREAIAVAAA